MAIMKKYLTYPEYYYTDDETLEKLPQHWKLKQVRYLLKNGSEGTKIGPFGSALKLEDMVDDGVQVYGQENVIKRNFSLGKRKISFNRFKEMKMYEVFSGDILITMMGTNGKCDIVPNCAKKGIIDSHLLRVRVNNELITPNFFKRLVDGSPETKHQIIIQSKGSIMLGLNSSIVKSLYLPLPDISEQKIILGFLDYETAKIDNLIEKQQLLIELLKEKRQAVISHAVTKGLNPHVPMKDSNVEWLGNVPKHWDVKRCKNLFDFVTSGSRGWAEFYSDEGILFFRIANLTRDNINPKLISVQYVSPPKGSEGERSKINKNDLLISITADLGSVCVADHLIAGGYVSQHISLCRTNEMVSSSRWLAYFVLSDTAKEQLQGAGYGGTKTQLSLEDIRGLCVAYPPKIEQEEIALYLDKRFSELDNLDHRAHDLVEILKERRTALISAAVTGKIDVRDWVAPEAPSTQPQDLEEETFA